MDNEYNEYKEPTAEPEQQEQYFCRFTFGQFFTIMVLEIITLCFVFYLGARYGTEYLKIDIVKKGGEGVTTTDAASASGEAETGLEAATDEEMIASAREKLKSSEKAALEQKVEDILSARATEPAAQPLMQPATPPALTGEAGQVVTPEPGSVPPSSDLTGSPPAPLRAGEPPAAAGQEAQELLAAMQKKPAEQVTTPVKVKSAAAAQYSVQVGAYPTLPEANDMVDRWKSRGYPAYLMIADLPGKGRWYRVRIGAFPSKDEAAKYMDNFSAREKVEAIVVFNEE